MILISLEFNDFDIARIVVALWLISLTFISQCCAIFLNCKLFCHDISSVIFASISLYFYVISSSVNLSNFMRHITETEKIVEDSAFSGEEVGGVGEEGSSFACMLVMHHFHRGA